LVAESRFGCIFQRGPQRFGIAGASNPTGGSKDGVPRLDFVRRLTLQSRGSVVTSNAGLLARRVLDDAHGLSDLAGGKLAGAKGSLIQTGAKVGLI
jgi:hypothetical protein